MGQKISSHNKRTLADCQSDSSQSKPVKMCSCQKPAECPLGGHCLEESIIYKATVCSSTEEKCYIGATGQTFKKRFALHKASFRNPHNAVDTTLSKYIWELKGKEIPYTVRWEIVKHCSPYKCGTRKCDICLMEKFYILNSDPTTCLNRNSELLQKCRHRNKHKLGNVKPTVKPPDHGAKEECFTQQGSTHGKNAQQVSTQQDTKEPNDGIQEVRQQDDEKEAEQTSDDHQPPQPSATSPMPINASISVSTTAQLTNDER